MQKKTFPLKTKTDATRDQDFVTGFNAAIAILVYFGQLFRITLPSSVEPQCNASCPDSNITDIVVIVCFGVLTDLRAYRRDFVLQGLQLMQLSVVRVASLAAVTTTITDFHFSQKIYNTGFGSILRRIKTIRILHWMMERKDYFIV